MPNDIESKSPSSSKLPAVVDVDDLWHPEQIGLLLQPLKNAREDLKLTAYCVPNRLGPVHELKKLYPWITFAQHGWEHTHGECLSWTKDMAINYLHQAQAMGYEKIFKPPNWLFDDEIVWACMDEDVIFHHNEKDFVSAPGLRVFPGRAAWRKPPLRRLYLHTHLVRNPSTDWVGTHEVFIKGFDIVSEFLTIEETACTAMAVAAEMTRALVDGRTPNV